MDYIPLFDYLFEKVGAVGAILAGVAGFLGYLVWSDRRNRDEAAVPAEYQKLLDDHTERDDRHRQELLNLLDRYHEGFLDNTRALDRIATIFEERTRRQSKQ